MKKSFYKYLVHSGTMVSIVLLFQNCGPAKINSNIQTAIESSDSGYSQPNTPSVSPTPSPVSPTPAPVVSSTPSCAPAPTSSLVVNVKNTGAVGDAMADDTAAIQAAINQVAGTGGTVSVPAGNYMINALTSLNLGSNMTLKLESGAVLRSFPNNGTTYAVVKVTDKSNVNIIGGAIAGDRNNHIETLGEWGAGIAVYGGSNIVIQGTKILDSTGDGIIIRKGPLTAISSNITMCSIVTDNNRRQGLAILDARGVLVQNSIFQNANGMAPSAGINLAPMEEVSNVVIKTSQFLDNQGPGLYIYIGSTGLVSDSTISDNFISNNYGGIEYSGIFNSRITNNVISDSNAFGIQLTGATGNTISGNDITVTGNAAGNALLFGVGNTVSGNTIR